MSTSTAKIRVQYIADKRISAVQVKTGTVNFLADLTSFIRITNLRNVTTPEERIGIVFLEPKEFLMLKKCLYVCPELELDQKKIEKALKRKDIGE